MSYGTTGSSEHARRKAGRWSNRVASSMLMMVVGGGLDTIPTIGLATDHVPFRRVEAICPWYAQR